MGYYILMNAVCNCVICAVEYGAHMGRLTYSITKEVYELV